MSIVRLPQEIDLGRYRLTARLGHGGMAELFLGRLIGAAGFEKRVAIKRMLPNLSTDPKVVAMFENEGRIAAQLSHPNVCQVYELGEADGQLFLAMEFLRGLPWSEIVPSIPDRPVATLLRFVVGMIVQACEGLHYAHTSTDVDGRPRPIVHRDVSPSNLFVTNEGIVKVLDFGVSKVLTEATQTQTGTLKGKLSYMSPEQIRGEQLDARCDIFAIAVIAWEAIAGRALFDRESLHELVQAIAERKIPQLPGEGPVMARVDQVVRRALSTDRELRPASARAFALELQRAIEPHGAPMMPTELQAHISQWLEPNLARRSRELADVFGRARVDSGMQQKLRAQADADETSDEQTASHSAKPQPGVRLREASIVVRAGATNHDLEPATPTVKESVRVFAKLAADARHPTTQQEEAASQIADAQRETRVVLQARLPDETRVVKQPPPSGVTRGAQQASGPSPTRSAQPTPTRDQRFVPAPATTPGIGQPGPAQRDAIHTGTRQPALEGRETRARAQPEQAPPSGSVTMRRVFEAPPEPPTLEFPPKTRAKAATLGPWIPAIVVAVAAAAIGVIAAFWLS